MIRLRLSYPVGNYKHSSTEQSNAVIMSTTGCNPSQEDDRLMAIEPTNMLII
ncbi:Uncharacterized protein APZ42_006496, partial [Daphnia magna]